MKSETFETMCEIVGMFFLTILMIFVDSVLGGTILWAIYPHIHALFPTAAENGIIAFDLSWWDSVCVSWIFSILIKTQNINKK